MSQALYDRIGIGYSEYRQPDERIARRIAGALGTARTVLNVGAGAGSYEPHGRVVVAVEPSAEMIRQRSRLAAPAIHASAERLPFQDGAFDAALAVLTIHHWSRRDQGLAEMRRVACQRVVIFTWDPDHPGFWLLQDYLPEILAIDRLNFPPLREIEQVIGPSEIVAVPIPADCSDGFLGAYWRRPEMYLDARARGAISSFSKIASEAWITRLRRDLENGTWSERYGTLLSLLELDIGYRLVISRYAERYTRRAP